MCHLVSTDPVVSEEMSFEKVDDADAVADDEGVWPSYKLLWSLWLRGVKNQTYILNPK